VLRRSNFRRTVKWSNSVATIGAPGLHFHDLRHTGNTHAAATGASLRDLMDLMDRMGRDSARAALIYQHKTAAAGRAIADALSAQIESLEQAHSDGTDTS
jgi:integrase